MAETTATLTTVAAFEIHRRACLDADGRPVGTLPAFARDPERLVPLYRAMVRTRVFDARAVRLQRSGQLGTYASSLGQEAVGVGLASAMEPDDVLVPGFREHGAQLWRGVSPFELLLFWGGDERGSDFAIPREDFPIAIPVGSHAPHACGVALAFALREERRAAVCSFGDGATSKGDVYEALNLAGVWKLPVVFVAADNGWAISVSRDRQSAAATLAQKAIAAGIPGEQVDGNDVIAVRAAVGEALDRARSGDGPTLLEAATYRLADHTTSDDSSRYRDPDEVGAHADREPIARLRHFLESAGAWSREDEASLSAELEQEIESAVARYLETPAQAPGSIFEHLYAELPPALRSQRDALLAENAEPRGG